MKRIFQAAVLLLAITLMTTTVLAGDNAFNMPKDMVKLLPAQADGVLGISSLKNIDQLWSDILPENVGEEEVSLLPIIKETLLGFEEFIDRDEPLLITTQIFSTMGTQGIMITLVLPMKDKEQDFSSVPGIEELNIVHQGDYVGISTDPLWKPVSEKPAWTKNLRQGAVTGYLDLAGIIETNGFLIEMGLGAMQSQAQNGTDLDQFTTAEETLAAVNMMRAFLESAEGLEIVLDEKGESLHKNVIFSTKPDSPLAPGPQPSFDDAFKLTRFLPGGESLLMVSALDQSRQMEIFADYYLASVHSRMAGMESETGKRYAQWYTRYLNTMEISFLPSALTLRVEKDKSSFQYLLQSNYVMEDFDRLVQLTDGFNNIGSGVNMTRIDSEKIDEYEILGWKMDLVEEELQGIFNSTTGSEPSDPLMATTLMSIIRFVPGNFYMTQVDDYILICGGFNADLMKKLVRNTAKGRGNVDPRVKKALKNSGKGIQTATVGDLNALMQMITEIMEEIEESEDANADPKPTFNWPLDKPMPFLLTMEIDEAEYLAHFAMEKAVIRELIQALMEAE